jgi:hypothetical protein
MILLSFDKLGFVTREQMQQIHDLGGFRNANRILNTMEKEGYLQSFRHNLHKVYYLTKQGLDVIGSSKDYKKGMQTDHYLMRNDMYIHYQCPETWKSEAEIDYTHLDNQGGVVMKKKKTLRSDARFKDNGIYHFLEVDNTQDMNKNERKIEQYRQLKETWDQDFILVFYTLSPVRREKLKIWCQKAKLGALIYTKEDIH